MKASAERLETILEELYPALKKISEQEYALKPQPHKWSKKEILGHLVDSAQNNIRRFIVAQYEVNPTVNYNQDVWVSVNGYQEWETSDLLQLWFLINKQVCAVLSNTSPNFYGRACTTHEINTLDWLAEDYVKHLEHHLHVILELEPVDYP